jgi:hypothetical protein
MSVRTAKVLSRFPLCDTANVTSSWLIGCCGFEPTGATRNAAGATVNESSTKNDCAGLTVSELDAVDGQIADGARERSDDLIRARSDLGEGRCSKTIRRRDGGRRCAARGYRQGRVGERHGG